MYKRKRKLAYKRLAFAFVLMLLIFSDVFNFSFFHWGVQNFKGYNNASNAYYVSVTVQQSHIYYNEEKISFDLFQEKLLSLDKKRVVIYLMDYGAYSDKFIKVHKFINDNGYKTVVSQKIPNISYRY
ncbi:hypothetical protein EDC19_2129 [Natranaerovirga hydrolytica]|uniref:Uncharacterized protein n=1 Tax=Natranaerovirga hydrolytica TaxID=680378 RepID=A0A4R1MM93_9FIRM|nr:hypothetical protein [Natranaerovirga hydrolytica]TCK92394.1 hypothetical protein EDC19_2129 [Natranaerovirga hydrolytica]